MLRAANKIARICRRCLLDLTCRFVYKDWLVHTVRLKERRMVSTVFRRVVMVLMFLASLPVGAWAQEATVSGTVTDLTGGVLPGVTITTTHTASGNTFVAVTDERGGYRIPLRVGMFKVDAELPGFGTVSRQLELLVGQIAVLNLQLAPSTVQESVTVTGEAPLVDTQTSTLGTNVDPRQMQELPVNGRN